MNQTTEHRADAGDSASTARHLKIGDVTYCFRGIDEFLLLVEPDFKVSRIPSADPLWGDILLNLLWSSSIPTGHLDRIRDGRSMPLGFKLAAGAYVTDLMRTLSGICSEGLLSISPRSRQYSHRVGEDDLERGNVVVVRTGRFVRSPSRGEVDPVPPAFWASDGEDTEHYASIPGFPGCIPGLSGLFLLLHEKQRFFTRTCHIARINFGNTIMLARDASSINAIKNLGW